MRRGRFPRAAGPDARAGVGGAASFEKVTASGFRACAIQTKRGAFALRCHETFPTRATRVCGFASGDLWEISIELKSGALSRLSAILRARQEMGKARPLSASGVFFLESFFRATRALCTWSSFESFQKGSAGTLAELKGAYETFVEVAEHCAVHLATLRAGPFSSSQNSGRVLSVA